MSAFAPGEGDAVVVPVAVVPVRAEPTHRAERISEWILGETVRIEALEGGWMRAAAVDGYSGWTPAGPFRVPPGATSAWERDATLRSLGTGVRSGPLARLPWGARLVPGPRNTCRLPGGVAVEPIEPDRIVPTADREDRPLGPEGLIEHARGWLGVPYAWGGRTELGVDCSGLVQALFAVRGIRLPRDSRDQSEAAGPRMEPDASRGLDGVRPGDLLFFAPEGRGVTHVALSEGGSRILHASSTRGCVSADDLSAADNLCRSLRESWVAWTRPLA